MIKRVLLNLAAAATVLLISLASNLYIIITTPTPQNMGSRIAGFAISIVGLVAGTYWTVGAVNKLFKMLQESRNETPS